MPELVMSPVGSKTMKHAGLKAMQIGDGLLDAVGGGMQMH